MNTDFIPTEHRDLINRLFQQGTELLPKMDFNKVDLLHAAIGISGEAAEIELAVLGVRQTEAFAEGDDDWFAPPSDSPLDELGNPILPGIDVDNIVEELGDLLFYEGAYRIAGKFEELPVLLQRNTRVWHRKETPMALANDKLYGRKLVICQLTSALTVTAGKLLDATKKHVMYNAPLNADNVCQALDSMAWCVSHIAYVLGYTEEHIRRGNINKLNLRYPAGYSDKAAQERADKEGEQDDAQD